MSNPLFGAFTSIGEAFAEKVTPFIQNFQNSVMPNTKPTNTNTFSFDLGGSFKKAQDILLAGPVAIGDTIFKSISAPATSTPKAVLQDLLSFGYNAGKTIAASYVDKVATSIREGNKIPTSLVTVAPSATNPTPSQGTGLSVGDLLSFLNASTTPAVDTIAAQASRTAQNSIFLVGGAALLLMLVVTMGKGK